MNGVLHNVLCAYTSNNADHSPCGLYAYDADTGAALWQTVLPPSATYTTAAPVIDRATGMLYVLTKTDNDDTGQTFLRAFDITTGAEKTGSPIQVTASAAGTGDGSVNGRVSFDGPAASRRFHANDRPGLLLLNGVVYTAFAHNSDSFPYHGWIIGYRYDGAHFTQTAAFCTTPNGGDGGIWQSGKGLTADAAGFLYCSVGNGTFDANRGGPDYGMCYLKLRASDLSVVDWFAPHDEQTQSDKDLDLGNSGVVGIPGTTRLFGGATKFGTGFLMDGTNLGRFAAGGPDGALLRLDGLTANDSVGQNPVAWDAGAVKYVYLWASGSDAEQFRYDPSAGTFSPAGIYKRSSGLTTGGSLAVSSAGTSGGILWGVGGDSVVRAFDATDVSKAPLWTSALNPSRDGLGSVGHFQFPTVVGGKVYVPTGDHTIVVYGLLTPPPTHTHLLWTNTNGTAAIWTIAPDGSVTSTPGYGPITGWTAKTIADGADGKTRLLWTRGDGMNAVWTVNTADGTVTSTPGYGPIPGWNVASLAVGPDDLTRLQWKHSPDGMSSVWTLAGDGFVSSTPGFGPYGTWTAGPLVVSGDDPSRLLWGNGAGRFSVWAVAADGSFTSTPAFGPIPGWTASALAGGPDANARLLLNRSDGAMAVWTVNGLGAITSTPLYGPIPSWNCHGIAVGPDGLSRVLWGRTDGMSSVWTVAADGSYTSTPGYGPIPGWSAVAITAGP